MSDNDPIIHHKNTDTIDARGPQERGDE